MSDEAATCALSHDSRSLLVAHRNSERSLALWDPQRNSLRALWDTCTAHTKDIEACSLFLLLRKPHSSFTSSSSSPSFPLSALAATITPPAQVPTAAPAQVSTLGPSLGHSVVAADDAATASDLQEHVFNPTKAGLELSEPNNGIRDRHVIDDGDDDDDDDDTDSGYEVHDTCTTLEDVIESSLLAVSACSEKICVWDSEADRPSANRLLLNVSHHGGADNDIVWCYLTTSPHCEFQNLKLIAGFDNHVLIWNIKFSPSQAGAAGFSLTATVQQSINCGNPIRYPIHNLHNVLNCDLTKLAVFGPNSRARGSSADLYLLDMENRCRPFQSTYRPTPITGMLFAPHDPNQMITIEGDTFLRLWRFEDASHEWTMLWEACARFDPPWRYAFFTNKSLIILPALLQQHMQQQHQQHQQQIHVTCLRTGSRCREINKHKSYFRDEISACGSIAAAFDILSGSLRSAGSDHMHPAQSKGKN